MIAHPNQGDLIGLCVGMGAAGAAAWLGHPQMGILWLIIIGPLLAGFLHSRFSHD